MDSSKDDPITKARTEVAHLQERKRRVYLAVLAFTIAITLLSWWTGPADDPFIASVYPVFATVLAVLFLLMLRRIVELRRLEIVMVVVAAVVVLSRLAWHFHFGDAIDEHLLVLAGGHYWAVGAMIVAAFVVLGYRRGLVAGITILALATVIAISGLLVESANDVGVAGETLAYLLRVHLFLALLLALCCAGMAMQDRLQNALVRAEVLGQWANTDMLSGLANRRAGQQFLERAVAQAARHERPLAVISADIDRFKRINDTRGHAIGDAIIAETAERLSACVRDTDLVVRWGGEEFLIVAPDSDVDGARDLAERCRRAVEDTPIAGVWVTSTFGVTAHQPGDTVDRVLARVDALLYSGKHCGRNVVIAEAGDTPVSG